LIWLEVIDLRSPNDFDGAFPALIDKRVGGISVVVGPLTYLLRQQIADAAIKYHLPAITNAKQFAQAGLLMSYGPNLDDLYRQAANYVDKILRGAAPAELPVQQPSKFELTINLKTARALGVKIPQPLVLLAEEVIE